MNITCSKILKQSKQENIKTTKKKRNRACFNVVARKEAPKNRTVDIDVIDAIKSSS